ncbi:hypothetical protein EJ05DRAFT_111721 [Pseudovirgaria hyperparasitica]|uniref:Uncharacterized protein n=1 Tax=Pseudovirgaria hyperparasitica TaxID=470096 RepID=A0A6A6VZD3_9PEZI|nr:uncharacterized protein EJ05DRAFT_111721 [Pseudovirgaria hyperparasitica]KAF2755673.1 hypothetical protein EJ05DRAFT_111721 [Pseudovirgaria hyperparasitica]
MISAMLAGYGLVRFDFLLWHCLYRIFLHAGCIMSLGMRYHRNNRRALLGFVRPLCPY